MARARYTIYGRVRDSYTVSGTSGVQDTAFQKRETQWSYNINQVHVSFQFFSVMSLFVFVHYPFCFWFSVLD